ncbi:hypothetical protein AMECASPLE_030254 [Ameca splendens]|uniref:Uncharacterized protein n=1 Tax=Ameca splendens TaxID=208324 RepID=A0ABV0YT02_9TELE
MKDKGSVRLGTWSIEIKTCVVSTMQKIKIINGPNLVALVAGMTAHPKSSAQSTMSLLSISKPADAPPYSRCAQPKDARHESNGKFITYSYPPPLPIITTISRHLQCRQSQECIQAIRAASATALTAAPSEMGLIL